MEMISPYVWVGMKYRRYFNAMTPNDVVNAVCDYYNITTDQIRFFTRRREWAHPRQICMYLLKRKFPSVTDRMIGEMLGGFDRTTLIHNIKAIQNLCDSSEDYRKEIHSIILL